MMTIAEEISEAGRSALARPRSAPRAWRAGFSQVNALAATACPTDYKALVCVFLFGGNDGNNTVIPDLDAQQQSRQLYANYAKVRGGLALPQASLNPINTSKGDQYGLHPSLMEIASLYNNKKNVAVLANVGTLVTPLTQTDYLSRQSDSAESVLASGSANRMADLGGAGLRHHGLGRAAGRRHAELQHQRSFPTIVSVGGNALFATGSQTNPATVTPGQVLGLQGF